MYFQRFLSIYSLSRIFSVWSLSQSQNGFQSRCRQWDSQSASTQYSEFKSTRFARNFLLKKTRCTLNFVSVIQLESFITNLSDSSESGQRERELFNRVSYYSLLINITLKYFRKLIMLRNSRRKPMPCWKD